MDKLIAAVCWSDSRPNLHPADRCLLTCSGAAMEQVVHEEELLPSDVRGGHSGADGEHFVG